MQSVSHLFETLGGPTKVARILGVGFTTASEMKRRGSIPVKYWPKIVGVSRITYEQLVEMHANPTEAA